MSQAGYTLIQLYYSATAAAAPSAGNLANGELAVNITDGKLFYKDNAGVVQVLATKAAAGGTFGAISVTSETNSGTLTLSGGTANGVAYLNGSKVLTTGSALTFDGSLLKLGSGAALSVQGVAFPASGSGAEIFWDGSESIVQSYNRTSSAYVPLWLESSYTRFGINGSEQMRLTSIGLGVGTTSPATGIELKGSSPSITVNGTTTASFRGFSIRSNGTEIASMLAEASAGESRITAGFSGFGGFQTFYTNGLERARIDSSGNLLVGTTSDTTGRITSYTSTASQAGVFIRQSSTSGAVGCQVAYGTAFNNTLSQAFYFADGTLRFEVRSNGGIANYAANNVILSDRREKTNFSPATSYLKKICSIPVQTFNYIDQNREEDDGLTLGVVAQDVQAVAPELVTASDWGTKEEPKMRLSIYQTDMQYALMKCIQEQQAMIESLTTRIATIESK